MEADALAAGLARLSGPNLQRRERQRAREGRPKANRCESLPVICFIYSSPSLKPPGIVKPNTGQPNNVSCLQSQIKSLVDGRARKRKTH